MPTEDCTINIIDAKKLQKKKTDLHKYWLNEESVLSHPSAPLAPKDERPSPPQPLMRPLPLLLPMDWSHLPWSRWCHHGLMVAVVSRVLMVSMIGTRQRCRSMRPCRNLTSCALPRPPVACGRRNIGRYALAAETRSGIVGGWFERSTIVTICKSYWKLQLLRRPC
jgi:hypothetical protein